VKLVLEGGFSRAMVCEELSVCYGTLLGWIEKYRRGRVPGLEPMRRSDAGRDNLPKAITEEIIALKEKHQRRRRPHVIGQLLDLGLVE